MDDALVDAENERLRIVEGWVYIRAGAEHLPPDPADIHAKGGTLPESQVMGIQHNRPRFPFALDAGDVVHRPGIRASAWDDRLRSLSRFMHRDPDEESAGGNGRGDPKFSS